MSAATRPPVLFLLRKYPPEHTGDGRLVRELAARLAARGHPVRVVCARPPGGPARDEGVEVLDVPRPPVAGRIGLRVALHGRALAELLGARRPDVVFSVAGDPLLAGLAAAARARGIAWVHRTSLFGADDAETLGGTARGRVLLRTLRGAGAHVAVTTDLFRPGYRAAGWPDERIHLLPPPIDVARFRPADPAERRALREDLGLSGDPLVVFVGGVIPRKGVDLLVRAWTAVVRRYPDARLLLVGPVDRASPFQAGLEAVLASAGTAATVRFAGRQDDPAPFVRAADVCAFPSRREGFGIAPLEAAAAGLPVVTTRFEGFSDLLGSDGEELVVVPVDADALADGLLRVLGDPALRARLATAGPAWVRDRLAPEPLADRWSALVAEMASGGA